MRSPLLVVLIALSLSACSVRGNYVITTDSISNEHAVHVQDARTELSKRGGKPKLLSYFYYHGDSSFDPTKMALFQSALAKSFDKPPQEVVLTAFDVVDSHAKRTGAAQAAALASVSAAAAVGANSGAPDSDHISCLIEATVDGRRISAQANSPYKESMLSLNVFRDPAYTAAVDAAVRAALDQWVSKARAQAD